jgi:vacuolar-type H+-ATPase subunit H
MIDTRTGKTRVHRDPTRRDLSTMLGKKKTLTEQLRDQASDLADALAPHVESARDKAGPLIADARDKAAPLLADARDKAGPYLTEARDKAAPLLADARDKAAPVVSDARDRFQKDVLPAVTAALASLDEATEEVRAEGKKRGKAVVAAAKGEVAAPEKKHRFRTLLIVVGLGGIAYAATKALGKKQPTNNWQSSYTPPPAPTPPPAGGPVAGGGTGAHRAEAPHDEAASDPAEAASDAADEPHAATTPDNPVEEVDVTKK